MVMRGGGPRGRMVHSCGCRWGHDEQSSREGMRRWETKGFFGIEGDVVVVVGGRWMIYDDVDEWNEGRKREDGWWCF